MTKYHVTTIELWKELVDYIVEAIDPRDALDQVTSGTVDLDDHENMEVDEVIEVVRIKPVDKR